MSRPIQHGLFVAAALLALVVIANGIGNSEGESVKEPRAEKSSTRQQADVPEPSRPDRIPVTKRANSLGPDENSPEPHRFTCMQLQVIDEMDLIGNTDCD